MSAVRRAAQAIAGNVVTVSRRAAPSHLHGGGPVSRPVVPGLASTPASEISSMRRAGAKPFSTSASKPSGKQDDDADPSQRENSQDPSQNADRGAIGGFMRGLMGGRDVAAEDAFVAEAKEQGIELPPPPPPRRSDLVAVKRRRRREEEDAEGEEQTIRDRLFSRFAGSAFMRNAVDAKDRIAERIDESNNPIINLFRNVYDRLFAENEMAMVVREIREDDATFIVSEFLRHVEADLIPNILSAYLAGDRDKLGELCTEDACRMLNASIREREAEGIVMDTNLLDISDVELTAGRLLEDAPVLIVTFSTQQINCLRDRSGEIIEGALDDIRAVYYVWALVREVDLEHAAPTGGGIGADIRHETRDDSDTETHSPGPDSEKGESKSAKAEPPPWKLMEMVIRGAHSTI